jgi:hypothetical protein
MVPLALKAWQIYIKFPKWKNYGKDFRTDLPEFKNRPH